METEFTGTVPASQRAAMIAEAAYFAAERRNFQPGEELADWLAAEQAIESSLAMAKPAGKKASKKVAKKSAAKKKPVAKKAASKKAAAKKTVTRQGTAKKAGAKKAAKKK